MMVPMNKVKRMGRVRKVAQRGGCTMTVMSGGLVSPKTLAYRFDNACCPWCSLRADDGASFDHMVWECEKRPIKLERPGDEMQARFGWPLELDRKKDEEILSWMKQVCEQMVIQQGYRVSVGKGSERPKGKGKGKGKKGGKD